MGTGLSAAAVQLTERLALEEQQRQERLAIAIARKEEEVAGLSFPFLEPPIPDDSA